MSQRSRSNEQVGPQFVCLGAEEHCATLSVVTRADKSFFSGYLARVFPLLFFVLIFHYVFFQEIHMI